MIHNHEIFPLLLILQYSCHVFTQQVDQCRKCSSTIISWRPGFISTKKKWLTNDKQDPNKNSNCLASAWPGVLTLYFNKTRVFTWTLADIYCKKKCHEVNGKFSSLVWLFINVTVVLKWIVLVHSIPSRFTFLSKGGFPLSLIITGTLYTFSSKLGCFGER